MFETFRVQVDACCACGSVLDAATTVTCEGLPEAGDFTVCVYCGAVLQWVASGSRLGLINASKKALGALSPKERVALELARAFFRHYQQLCSQTGR